MKKKMTEQVGETEKEKEDKRIKSEKTRGRRECRAKKRIQKRAEGVE